VKLLERAVDRPLPTFLVAALVVVLGVWSLNVLPVKRTPQVEIPFALVYVPYIGATPDDVESEVTIDLEEHLNTLDDLRHMTSISSEGVSTHFLEFEDRTDMNESLRAVQDEARLAEVDFPDDVDAPVVKEISFDDLPIIFFTLRGGGDLYRLRDIAEDLVPDLEGVEGVSRVETFGGFEREVHVLADPVELAGYGLTLADLTARLSSQSHSRPAGELRAHGERRLIRATGEFRTLEEIRSVTVWTGAAGSLHLRDVARVELGHVRLTSGAWLNGEPSVTLIVKRRPEINTRRTVQLLQARVAELQSDLPPGFRIDESSNSAEEIDRMIVQLGTSAAFGLVLVVFVLLLVFGVRQALLVGSVLPMSLLFTFIGLLVFDMEISNMALFSLILVLGLVVDGAIIIGEAIFAELEDGTKPLHAAKLGISRVGVPVLAADLTTVAAFLPMLLMVGVMGQFMSVMPKVVTFAILGSIFVDHFLLPAVVGRSTKAPKPRRQRDSWLSPEMPKLRHHYGIWLEAALRHRIRVAGGAALAFGLTGVIFSMGFVESIFLPKTDRAKFTINYALPEGTPLEETNRVGLLLASHVDRIPELDHYVLTTGDTGALSADTREGGRVGPGYGRISVELTEPSMRNRSQSEIVAWMREELVGYAGVELDIEERTEGPGVGAALAIRVKGESMDEIANVSRSVKLQLQAIPEATDVRVDYDETRPEIHVELDRARAHARFGITPDQVASTLLATYHGLEIGRMWVGEQRVDMRLQAPETTPNTLGHVGELPLRAGDGSMVPLSEVATLHLEFGKNAVFRHDTERTITVRADALEGISSVWLEQAARDALADIVLPAGVSLEFGGETEERDRSYSSLWRALKWGLALIYLILAVQFDSIKQPLIVLLTVPLALVGVTFGLLVTGTPFSFMVFIGIVSLTGIVVNSGIVMVDAINRKRRAGMFLEDALRVASAERLRPVLLTTVTTIVGLLPLTLNITRGGEFWVPLGVTIISGLSVASGLTLFIVPVLYSFFASPSRLALTNAPLVDDESSQ
jgi:multidrug efflux pump subunit AcrB